MPLHDAYARRTPYELAFPDLEGARAHFRAVEDEAEERGADPAADPEVFVMLEAVGRALRELRAPGEDAALIRQHGVLLWHAYRFWAAGETPTLLRLHAARYLLDPFTAPSWDGGVDPSAGYLQLPQHLVWVREDEGASPQSLDGFFWAATDDALHLLLAIGMRDDRPGLSVVPLGGLPLEEAPAWTDAAGRPDGGDFESTMPGAGLEGLKELRTAGEALKLAARALWHLGRVGGERREPPSGRAGPAPSALPHRIVDLE